MRDYYFFHQIHPMGALIKLCKYYTNKLCFHEVRGKEDQLFCGPLYQYTQCTIYIDDNENESLFLLLPLGYRSTENLLTMVQTTISLLSQRLYLWSVRYISSANNAIDWCLSATCCYILNRLGTAVTSGCLCHDLAKVQLLSLQLPIRRSRLPTLLHRRYLVFPLEERCEF